MDESSLINPTGGVMVLKRISVTILVAILFGLAVPGSAQAAEGPPGERIRVRGELVSVNTAAGKFQVETDSGDKLNFFVTEHTRFLGRAKSLSDLQVGWKLGVVGKTEGGKNLALGVISADLENRPEPVKVRGVIAGVDAAPGAFRLETKDGEILTFFVSEKTRYAGQAEDLDDLKAGWIAGVGAVEGQAGKLIAVLVTAGEPRERLELARFRGTVTEVDAAAGRFRLEAPDGEELTFFVSDRTRYRGQVEELSDLQIGWKAGVGALEDQENRLQAVLVLAGDPEDIPEGVRVRGSVTAVDLGLGTFRLETPEGEALTFFVREVTRYLGQLESLGDLEVGWRAGVVGFEGEDGQLQAVVVGAREPGLGDYRERVRPRGEDGPPGNPPGRPDSPF